MTNQFDDLKKTANTVADDASSRLNADMKALREDIASLTTSVTDLVKSQASTARTSVMSAVDDARERVATTADNARERVSGATSDLEAAIERNPLLAVAAAMIAGLFVGVLSRPRS